MISIEEIKNRLAIIIESNMNIPREEVVFEDDLLDTLGITSLQFLLMLADIEGEFNIYIPEEEIRMFTTPIYVVEYLYKVMNR